MKRDWFKSTAALSALAIAFAGCGKGKSDSANAAPPASENPPAAANGDNMVPLSTFGQAEYCSITATSDGTIHAIFTDANEYGKPHFLYYRSSKDGGATWTEAKNLSDDESGIGAAYCRVIADGSGKLYAIWKYDPSQILEDRGGTGSGILAYRVMDGGNWSPIVRLGDQHYPMTSWFAALGPDKKVNVVWSQGNLDFDWAPNSGVRAETANILHQSVFDGTTPQTRDLITPKPIPTPDQIDAAHKAGNDIPYGDLGPHSDGLWDLRGYIDRAGLAHLVGEHYALPNPNGTGELLMLWDGKSLSRIYEYQKDKAFNWTNDPPELLIDPAGKEWLIRAPEEGKVEKACIRQYAMDGGRMGDHTDIIAPESVKGSITNWQAQTLADGRIAVTASISENDGNAPDGIDLFLIISDGKGGWTKPVNVTNNAAKASLHGNNAVVQSVTYTPIYAQSALLNDGSIGVLNVDNAHTVSGVNTVGITDTGRAVTGVTGFSTDKPYVFFKKVKVP